MTDSDQWDRTAVGGQRRPDPPEHPRPVLLGWAVFVPSPWPTPGFVGRLSAAYPTRAEAERYALPPASGVVVALVDADTAAWLGAAP